MVWNILAYHFIHRVYHFCSLSLVCFNCLLSHLFTEKMNLENVLFVFVKNGMSFSFFYFLTLCVHQTKAQNVTKDKGQAFVAMCYVWTASLNKILSCRLHPE